MGPSGRKVFDFQIWNEIIFVREIAYRPQQAGRYGFRLSFNSQLGFPLGPIGILDLELGILSVLIFLQELYRQLRTMLFAAGTVQQIF